MGSDQGAVCPVRSTKNAASAEKLGRRRKPNKRQILAAVDKENICPHLLLDSNLLGTSTSPLPEGYPRIPLQDITDVLSPVTQSPSDEEGESGSKNGGKKSQMGKKKPLSVAKNTSNVVVRSTRQSSIALRVVQTQSSTQSGSEITLWRDDTEEVSECKERKIQIEEVMETRITRKQASELKEKQRHSKEKHGLEQGFEKEKQGKERDSDEEKEGKKERDSEKEKQRPCKEEKQSKELGSNGNEIGSESSVLPKQKRRKPLQSQTSQVQSRSNVMKFR